MYAVTSLPTIPPGSDFFPSSAPPASIPRGHPERDEWLVSPAGNWNMSGEFPLSGYLPEMLQNCFFHLCYSATRGIKQLGRIIQDRRRRDILYSKTFVWAKMSCLMKTVHSVHPKMPISFFSACSSSPSCRPLFNFLWVSDFQPKRMQHHAHTDASFSVVYSHADSLGRGNKWTFKASVPVTFFNLMYSVMKLREQLKKMKNIHYLYVFLNVFYIHIFVSSLTICSEVSKVLIWHNKDASHPTISSVSVRHTRWDTSGVILSLDSNVSLY